MAVRLSTALASSLLNATGLKAKMADGLLLIFSGSQPSSADDAATGTLLAVVYSDGATASAGLEFDAPVDNVVSKAAAETWSGVALASGTAGWFRFAQYQTSISTTKSTAQADDSGTKTNARIDGSIGVSGADLNISNTSIVSGAMQTVSSFSITLPLV